MDAFGSDESFIAARVNPCNGAESQNKYRPAIRILTTA